jgi:23S rRNA pseudouridine2605 synthase
MCGGERLKAQEVFLREKKGGRPCYEVVLQEGKNRQIRKMLDAVSVTVQRLKRTAVGPLKLGQLRQGAWRELSADELRSLRGAVGLQE